MAEAQAFELDHRHADFVSTNFPPQPTWIRLTTNIWSHSFFVAPIGLAMLVCAALMVLRPGELDLRTYIVAWFLSGPAGFLLWVFAWKMYGGGTGHITANVASTAVLGWCAWHRGWYIASIERRFSKGLSICLVTGLAAMTVKSLIGNSTAPISLAMLTAFAGSGFPLCVVLSAKMTNLMRRFANTFVAPTWRLLNRPVTLDTFSSSGR